jgi:hypothetical protein
LYGYNVETKAQSSVGVKRVTTTEKAKQMRQNVKVMLTVFFFFLDSQGVLRHEFLSQGKTVTEEYYLEVMKRLREAIRKRSDAWRSNRRMLHADSAPAHTSLLFRKFLAKHETTVVP